MTHEYSGFSILHGEDDVADARVMKKVLQDIEYTGDYHCLNVGHDVVSWAIDQSNILPKLILLDIGLPGLNGKEILNALRANERTMGVPIVMVTGSSSLRDYEECIRLGANGYLIKSADRPFFTGACRNFIEGWAHLTEQKFF